MPPTSPVPAQDRLSSAFVKRFKLITATHHPGNPAFYRAMQLSAAEFRKCLAGRASFTPAQIEIGNIILRKASPFTPR